MSETGESRGSILVLEDDAGIRRLQRNQLERDGYQVHAAGTIDEARQILAREKADLLVLDYQLENGENGLEFYRQLRASGVSAPAVLVTGFSDEARMLEAMRAGVREFLPKTPNFVELLSPTVAHVLERVHQERRLVEAEAAASAKDEFLATLSHELRTPLTPVLALVPSLQGDARLPEDVREDLAIINRNILLEARLIDDLLDLTRITKGKIELNYAPVDVGVLIEHTMESFCRLEATNKGLRIEQQLTAANHVLQADGARLTQVLWNLLGNATKFTPPGGSITVRTSLQRASAGDWLAIEVEDTGMGIEPEALLHIFDLFEQGGSSITRQYGGLGLGLAISRAIVRLHHGTITAESDGPDRGARFTVRLPVRTIAPGGKTSPAQPSEELRAGTDRSAHVLLVEDHGDTARVLSRLLRRAGFHVTTVNSVADALAATDRAQTEATLNGQPLPIQLVLSDLGLPDGTGVQLMERLRERYQMPSIALSGFGMEEDVREALQAGFDRHFTKPVEFERLIAVIRELLSPAQSRSPAAAADTGASPARPRA